MYGATIPEDEVAEATVSTITGRRAAAAEAFL